MCHRVELDPASKLGKFFEETKDDSPTVRSEKLEAHKAISEIHNKVAKEGQSRDPVQYALEFWVQIWVVKSWDNFSTIALQG